MKRAIKLPIRAASAWALTTRLVRLLAASRPSAAIISISWHHQCSSRSLQIFLFFEAFRRQAQTQETSGWRATTLNPSAARRARGGGEASSRWGSLLTPAPRQARGPRRRGELAGRAAAPRLGGGSFSCSPGASTPLRPARGGPQKRGAVRRGATVDKFSWFTVHCMLPPLVFVSKSSMLAS